MKNIVEIKRLIGVILVCFLPTFAFGGNGAFDIDRWYATVDGVRARAKSENISDATIEATLKSLAFIPSIVKSDKNQSEFKMTLNDYLNRTVSSNRIIRGHQMREKYPTMLKNVEKTYGVPPHIILAFWGMESNYGEVKSRHKLTDAFMTLMYDGRRETFFGNQLIALMKIADKNHLDINNIYGSWAGAMGHFQFIPTTLAQYGVDGNGDGRIDIINNISDAMFSAGNYLHTLGWNKDERIVRRVVIPYDFNRDVLDGNTKKTLVEWSNMGVTNPDGTAIPDGRMMAGLVLDKDAFTQMQTCPAPEDNPDSDVAPRSVVTAYLTYPNFYRIKKWNNSNWYAIAIATLADRLK